MIMTSFLFTPEKLDGSAPHQLAAPDYAYIEASDAHKIQVAPVDAQTHHVANMTSPELSTPKKWSLSFQPEILEWTPKYANRFSELAAKYALGEIISDEQSEYEELTQIRRRLNHPRSGAEVVVDFERRRAMMELEEALHRYVFFLHNSASGR